MNIITHRGLEPSKKEYFLESSREAFVDQLARGYGIEFDLRLTRDDKIVIVHDASLKRLTNGIDEREIRSVTADEILTMNFNGSHLTTLDNLLKLIEKTQAPNTVSAIHLKIELQEKRALDVILSYLERADVSKFYVFDTTIETAKYLKEKNPRLRIAPSVALSYDIERYNSVVGGTLLSVEQALSNRELFDGVWLDEWDLVDKNGKSKKLYTKEIFDLFKKAGFWVALVTPELHGTSPGLLGGEAHEDGQDKIKLFSRLREIISLKPDAICTDYPDYVLELMSQKENSLPVSSHS